MKNLPNFSPMLPVSGGVDDDAGFVHEIKWDGFRALAYVAEGVRLESRNGLDLTDQFFQIAHSLSKLQIRAVLDGEIIALTKEGRPEFSLLQGVINPWAKIMYIIFDLLFLEGSSLCPLPWQARRRQLEQLDLNDGILIISPLLFKTAAESVAFAAKHRLEGIVSKQRDSPYLAGIKSSFWRKQKLVKTLDCVVVRLNLRENKVRSIGVALFEKDGSLVSIGNVGSGLTNKELDFLQAAAALLGTDHCPIKNPPLDRGEYIWLKPHLVAEIKYLEFTPQNNLRQPVFLRFRFDKQATECLLTEEVN